MSVQWFPKSVETKLKRLLGQTPSTAPMMELVSVNFNTENAPAIRSAAKILISMKYFQGNLGWVQKEHLSGREFDVVARVVSDPSTELPKHHDRCALWVRLEVPKGKHAVVPWLSWVLHYGLLHVSYPMVDQYFPAHVPVESLYGANSHEPDVVHVGFQNRSDSKHCYPSTHEAFKAESIIHFRIREPGCRSCALKCSSETGVSKCLPPGNRIPFFQLRIITNRDGCPNFRYDDNG
jgi:hypothetical protein